MTSQTDNQIGNLCSDFLSSIVFSYTKKNHNLLINNLIFTQFSLLNLSCFSASIKTKLFLEWT